MKIVDRAGTRTGRRASISMWVLAAVWSVWLPASAVDAQDAVAGAGVFRQQCQMCHAVSEGAPPGIGPDLFGAVGRPAAGTAYDYSAGLKASRLVWNTATLDKFLSGPSKLVSGTKMPVTVSDASRRADIIAYLATLRK